MFDQATRKYTPEVAAEETVRLSPEWLNARLAEDVRDDRDVSDTATTRETSFEAPTRPAMRPEFLDRASDDYRAAERLVDLRTSLGQFAAFGWDRQRTGDCLGEIGVTRRDLNGRSFRSQFVREYLAIHQRCDDGLSVTDIAAANAQYVESSTRFFVKELALSYWDIYEVVGVRDDSATLSSRFDSRLRVVHGGPNFEPGDVIVARVVDVGCGSVASSVIFPTFAQQAALHDILTDEFNGRSWAGFMRAEGARIILRWVCERVAASF